MKPTHNTFEAMAAAIFKAAEEPDFPGIVPWDNPTYLLTGYVKAVPRSQRTPEDQWSCQVPFGREHDPEILLRLRGLVKL